MKAILVDIASGAAATGVANLAINAGFPDGAVILLSFATGITVAKLGMELFIKVGGLSVKATDDVMDALKNNLDEADWKVLSETVEEVSGTVDDTVKSVTFDMNKYISQQMKQFGMGIDDFNNLRLKPVAELTDQEVLIMKQVRDGIPWITPDTMIQKTLPLSDVDNYLTGKYNTVGGYVAKLDDVNNLSTYDDVVEGLRLDYLDANGNRIFPENGDGYAVIRYTIDSVDNIEIPYGATFGGTNTDGLPCTQNGFTGARNGYIVPEWKFNNRFLPNDGAELYKVLDGKEVLTGVFDIDAGEFIPVMKGD